MNSQIRCLLVDDEPLAIDVLKTYIQSTEMLEIKGECAHAMAAFEILRREQIDLMFLDVNMPRMSGIEFLRALPHPPKVIITSAHKEFAVDGFEIGIVDYLLKPFSFDRFIRAVYRARHMDQMEPKTIERADATGRFIYVRADRKMIKVILDDLLYIESIGDYSRMFLRNGQVITKQKISSLEAMLPAQQFVRIHRSYVVNISGINSFNNTSVFIEKTELPVGPLFRNSAMSKIQNRS